MGGSPEENTRETLEVKGGVSIVRHLVSLSVKAGIAYFISSQSYKNLGQCNDAGSVRHRF